ncbi:hypothetical protein Efla_002114 [Eimeria flavescens]
MASRKSFRLTRGGGEWPSELVKAVASAEQLNALNVSAEAAGAAICKNFLPVIKKHIALAVQYDRDCFEAALVDEITQGEGPISCLELLQKVKQASQRIEELVGGIYPEFSSMGSLSSQTERVQELETNLAQANEYLEQLETIKEDALSAAQLSKSFARKEEERFPTSNKEFIERLREELREEVALEAAEQGTASAVATEARETQTDEPEPNPSAASPEAEEKEVQTDPMEPPHLAAEAVPVAPPPFPAAELEATEELENERQHAHRLSPKDRELLHSCIEEIRHLSGILAERKTAGLREGNARGNADAEVAHPSSSSVRTPQMDSCVLEGRTYEPLPLTTLQLTPVPQRRPELANIGTAMSPRGVCLLTRTPKQLYTHRYELIEDRLASRGAVCQPPAGSSSSRSRSPQTHRGSSQAAADTATVRGTEQQQTFVFSHQLSACPPDAPKTIQELSAFPAAADSETEAAAARLVHQASKAADAKEKGAQQQPFSATQQQTAAGPLAAEGGSSSGGSAAALEAQQSQQSALLPADQPAAAAAAEAAAAEAAAAEAAGAREAAAAAAKEQHPDESPTAMPGVGAQRGASLESGSNQKRQEAGGSRGSQASSLLSPSVPLTGGPLSSSSAADSSFAQRSGESANASSGAPSARGADTGESAEMQQQQQQAEGAAATAAAHDREVQHEQQQQQQQGRGQESSQQQQQQQWRGEECSQHEQQQQKQGREEESSQEQQQQEQEQQQGHGEDSSQQEQQQQQQGRGEEGSQEQQQQEQRQQQGRGDESSQEQQQQQQQQQEQQQQQQDRGEESSQEQQQQQVRGEESSQQEQQQQQQLASQAEAFSSAADSQASGVTTADSHLAHPAATFFGKEPPNIWPVVTCGSTWRQSRQTKTIHLTPLRRRVREDPTLKAAPVARTSCQQAGEAGRGQAGAAKCAGRTPRRAGASGGPPSLSSS